MKGQIIHTIAPAYSIAILLIAMQFNAVFLLTLSAHNTANLLLFGFFLTAALTSIRDMERPTRGTVDLIICVFFFLAGAGIGHKPKCFFFMALWAGMRLASDLRFRTGPARQTRSGAVCAAAIAGLTVPFLGKGGPVFYLSIAGALLLISLTDYFYHSGRSTA